MKLSTTEKIMKIWGWVSLVILVLGIPAQFVNKYLLKLEFEPLVMVMYIISSLVEMLLSVGLIRCKKDSFLVVAMSGQVIYRIVTIIMNLSTVSIFTFINLAIFISLLGFVVVNCVPKLSEYKSKINQFWFVPSVVMFILFVIGFIKDLNEKLPESVKNAAQEAGTGTAVQTFSLSIGASSSILAILPYFLLCYWLYKSNKIEN